MMLLVDEPGTRRLFVNDMRGLLYSVSYDGGTVTRYLDLSAPTWELRVEASRNERGFQSFAFHPQFNQGGTAGFGKFYTYTDTSHTAPTPDFVPGGGGDAQDTVLLEWDGQESRRRDLRWRRAARADPARATLSQSQRRPDRLQPARVPGGRRFRSALHRLG